MAIIIFMTYGMVFCNAHNSIKRGREKIKIGSEDFELLVDMKGNKFSFIDKLF